MFTKLISFVIGLSLVAGLCSLDVGWEIVVQTHAETGVSLNKLSSSITAFINITGVGFQTTFLSNTFLKRDRITVPHQSRQAEDLHLRWPSQHTFSVDLLKDMCGTNVIVTRGLS